MSAQICCLREVEAREFEEKGTLPNCQFHRHFTYRDIELLESGKHPDCPDWEFRWVGDRYKMIVILRFMVLRPRDGLVCLVPGVVSGHMMGARTRFADAPGPRSRAR